jgi:tetratricopeptide (TPR) repeat protein
MFMSKRISFLALSFLLAAAPALLAQEWRGGRARVEGTVKNQKGEPVAGAKVSLRWGEAGHGGPDLTTNKKGSWAFFGLVGGSWNIDFEAPGYKTKKITVNLTEAGRNTPIEVDLEPVPEAKPQEQELLVGGHKISKEAAAAIEAGNTAMDAKNYREAREQYLKALAELPDYAPLLTRIAAVCYAEGNTDESIRYARRVLEKNPQDYVTWRMIAEIELQRGNLEAGKQALAKVPEDQIRDAQPYFNMGVLLINKKKYAEAEAALSKALAVASDLAEAYYYRAIARIQLKKKAEAKADLQKNLDLAPNGPDSKDVKDLLHSLQ